MKSNNLPRQTFGGSNWGNLGHQGGYSSYDYGAPITESRNLTRQKYSELKLLGNFIKVSAPSYLIATPGILSAGVYTDTTTLTTTPLLGNNSASFFVVRQSNYASLDTVNYKLTVPTSAGNLTIPQLGGELTLIGRDSKIHVVDYDVAGTKILYSTAEVFTWKEFTDSKVLVLYGQEGEYHEVAISSSTSATIQSSSSGVTSENAGDQIVIGWNVSSERQIVQVDDLKILLLSTPTSQSIPQYPTHYLRLISM
jgi:beta-galactosidase